MGDEIDPNLFEPLGAAFATMNRISPAQRDFCERTVKEMETDPYDKWTSLWKRAPDATLLDNTKFDQAVADGYDLLDVFFWSPSRLKQWKKLGVEMPCARHGWKHKDNVTVKQQRGDSPCERHHPRFHLGGPGVRLLGVPQGARATQ